jgi:hypothetical protein
MKKVGSIVPYNLSLNKHNKMILNMPKVQKSKKVFIERIKYWIKWTSTWRTLGRNEKIF